MRTDLTRLRSARPRTALVLLLVCSGLLFAVGSTIERHQHHAEHAAASAESGSGGETSTERKAHAETGHGESGVKVLGVNTESFALSVLAVVASLVLALVVWLGRWQRLTLPCVAGFGLLFAAGDARELVHQVNESNGGLAAIAAILIGLHLAMAVVAAVLYPRRPAGVSAAP